MNGVKFRLFGLTLLTGATLAVGCGDSGDDDDDAGANTNSTMGTPTNVTTSQTQSATSGGVTGTTSPSTSQGTTSTTGGTTGGGGVAGAGGACGDDTPVTPPALGAGGEGGAAGASGTIELSGEGYNFATESEFSEWSIDDCEDTCVTAPEAEIAWACGVIEVTINWPAAANTAAHQFRLQNLVQPDMLRDLSGQTLVVQARMTSDQVGSNGYDLNVITQDYIDDDDDTNDWGWYSTCWNGGTPPECPERPSADLYAPGDWATAFLTMDAAPDEFATDGIIKLGVEIASKHYENPATPFAYDSAPATFEINAFVW